MTIPALHFDTWWPMTRGLASIGVIEVPLPDAEPVRITELELVLFSQLPVVRERLTVLSDREGRMRALLRERTGDVFVFPPLGEDPQRVLVSFPCRVSSEVR